MSKDYTKSPLLSRKARDYFECIKKDFAWQRRYRAIMENFEVVPPLNDFEKELRKVRDKQISEFWED